MIRRNSSVLSFSSFIGVLLAFGGAAHALTVTATQNFAIAGGGIVTIEILGEGDFTSDLGYALIFEWDVFSPSATASSTAAPDPNAGFGHGTECNLEARSCIGANGGSIGYFQISDSVNTFTLSGLAPGTVVLWTTAGSSGLSAATSVASGSFTAGPEPGTALLLAAGLLALSARRHLG